MIAAIRFVMFMAATLGLYAVWFALRFFVPNKIYWRQAIFYCWTLSFVRISRMRIEVTGTPPKPPFFLVTNHLGYADIGVIRTVAAGVFVAKAEVSHWPLAGRIVRDLGMIFINRANRRDIPRAGELIMQRLEAGEGVIVFPEGTSTKGDDVLPFNSSFLEFAARSGVPVSYGSITYRTPAGEPPASTVVCWWEDIGFFAHLWRLLKVPEYTAMIHFGDAPILKSNRKELAAELHRRVLENFTPVV
jgi:1-acyl-sn-glycerol-3-phosphate acyltransferase